MENNDTFMKITNADIYKKLLDIENQQKFTNGKVKLHTAHIAGIWGTIGVVGSVLFLIVFK